MGAAGRIVRRAVTGRRWVLVVLGILLLGGGLFALAGERVQELVQDDRGTAIWAREHYGNSSSPRFRDRHIVEIDFLGRQMFVHRRAARHFLRLERLFEARAPEYAAGVTLGPIDDWSYANRNVRGGHSRSNHAFGIAIDVNALTNVMGTEGDMPMEVVEQWEIEGGAWGGRWSRSDPMHFETHLTPAEIRERYRADGTPRDWYLEELLGR